MSAAEGILVEVREILEKAPDASFGRGYVVQLVAELEELKLQYNAEEKRANHLFDARREAIQDAANVSYDLLQVKERAEKAEAEVPRLTKMVAILSEWCAQLESGQTLEEVGLALSNGMACPEPWQYADEAARRAVEGK